MGILNCTPDSFSDGGKFFDKRKALLHVKKMVKDGADIIDIGGESSRLGSSEVSIDEEIRRVIPIISKISSAVNRPISIDTRHSVVAKLALQNGASIVNDITGLNGDKEMASVIAKYDASVVLMHMRGTPKTMQLDTNYKSLIRDIIDSLKKSVTIAKDAGINGYKMIIDPGIGIGFGKSVEQNLKIIKRLEEFKVLKKPILIGTSRKFFIGKILDKKNTGDRLYGSIASVTASILNGANIVRVHDVRETVDAAKVADSILRA